jgi:spermidine synthase
MSASWFSEWDFDRAQRLQIRATPVHAVTTRFQELQVLEHEHLGRVLVLNGIIQTTVADEFVYHEMMANVPILGRAPGATRSVLIIGGGDGGVLREVLRHPQVERAVMVEIDAEVIEVCKKYLGFHGDYLDPRVQLLIGDGAAYVREESTRARPFDLAIVDSTDPVGPGERLFTEAFVRDLAACLTPEGVMVRQAGIPFLQRDEMPEAFRSGARAFGNAEVYRAAIPTYQGGDMAFVAARKGGGTLREPHMELRGRYYSPDVHRAAFALPEFWRERMAS